MIQVSMVERISSCEHEYGGKKIVAGQKFDVEPKHVGLLLLLNRIEPQEGEPGYVKVDPEDRPVPRRSRRNGVERM